MFKNHDPFLCAFITKWNDLTKGNLEYQRLLWGIFEIPKFNFLKNKLDYNSSKVFKTEQNAYFDWYFGTFEQC